MSAAALIKSQLTLQVSFIVFKKALVTCTIFSLLDRCWDCWKRWRCIADVSVADGKHNDYSLAAAANSAEGGGHLLRLDSSVDMKLGDLGGTCTCMVADTHPRTWLLLTSVLTWNAIICTHTHIQLLPLCATVYFPPPESSVIAGLKLVLDDVKRLTQAVHIACNWPLWCVDHSH